MVVRCLVVSVSVCDPMTCHRFNHLTNRSRQPQHNTINKTTATRTTQDRKQCLAVTTYRPRWLMFWFVVGSGGTLVVGGGFVWVASYCMVCCFRCCLSVLQFTCFCFWFAACVMLGCRGRPSVARLTLI